MKKVIPHGNWLIKAIVSLLRIFNLNGWLTRDLQQSETRMLMNQIEADKSRWKDETAENAFGKPISGDDENTVKPDCIWLFLFYIWNLFSTMDNKQVFAMHYM